MCHCRISQASLTIDRIHYVVDWLLELCNPKLGMDSLVVTPISAASASNAPVVQAAQAQVNATACMGQLENEMMASTIPEISAQT